MALTKISFLLGTAFCSSIVFTCKISVAAEVPVAPISAQEAISMLEEGNKRFSRGANWHPKQDKKTAGILLSAEHPHTVVVSCSDSRLPPEIVFDQGLGDLFVVRTLGGVLDSAAIASIEYAVEKLDVALIVVLGHESCSAINLATTDHPTGSPQLLEVLKNIRTHIAQTPSVEGDFRRSAAAKAHVNGVSADLVSRSEVVRNALNTRKVTLLQGLYSLDTLMVTISRDGRAPAHSH